MWSVKRDAYSPFFLSGGGRPLIFEWVSLGNTYGIDYLLDC